MESSADLVGTFCSETSKRWDKTDCIVILTSPDASLYLHHLMLRYTYIPGCFVILTSPDASLYLHHRMLRQSQSPVFLPILVSHFAESTKA